MVNLNAIGRRVLLIPDLHAPYHHPDALKFLAAIKSSHLSKRDLIVNVGDEVDHHALSFHDKDPDLDSAGPELEKSLKFLHNKGGLFQLFPDMRLCESNHGSLVYRKAKHHGIPRRYLRTYAEVLDTPTWSWEESYLIATKIGQVYICHGKSSAYGKMATTIGCSAIQGHYHSKFEITWHHSILQDRFNMFVGCLIDHDSLAMAYDKSNLPRPVLGVGLLSMDGTPQLIKMNLNSRGRWDGKVG